MARTVISQQGRIRTGQISPVVVNVAEVRSVESLIVGQGNRKRVRAKVPWLVWK